MASRFLLLSAGLAILAGSCLAQVTGRLSGSVSDPSGAPVPNAAVNLSLAGGSKPILTTVTTAEGLFSFTNVRPESYDLTVDSKGFLKYTLRGVKVDTARETSLPRIQLEVATVTQAVDVVADAQTIQTSNAEISTTVTNEQVRRLPLLDRDPISLIATQAGVSSNADDIVINGTRSSYSNITLDGINIQDNFIRTGGLGYQPNRLVLDQVSEFTISTSNTNATVGGGSSQITLTTPSGGNTYHGSAYWFNRNNAAGRCELVRQQRRHSQGLPQPEPARRGGGRPHHQGQAVLLYALRGVPEPAEVGAGPDHPHHRRPQRDLHLCGHAE